MPISYDYTACTNSIIEEEIPDLDVQDVDRGDIQEVSNSDYKQLSDAELEESIARLRKMLDDPNLVLKDNKYKLGLSLKGQEAELANRMKAKRKFEETRRQHEQASEKRGLTSYFSSPSYVDKTPKEMIGDTPKQAFAGDIKVLRFARTVKKCSNVTPGRTTKDKEEVSKTPSTSTCTPQSEKLSEKRGRSGRKSGSSKTVTLSSDEEDDGDGAIKAVKRTSLRLAHRRRVDSNHKINYPSRHDPEGVEVYYRDLNHLKPTEFLNDTVIDFYIKYLQRQQEPPSRMEKLHFFNSFFFKKLIEAFEAKGDKHTQAFTKLRKWTKGISIFDKAYLFLPINDKLHWSLVIVAFSQVNSSMLAPYIYHLDSLEGGHSSKEIFKHLIKYLEAEHAQMECAIQVSWDELVTERVEVPRQDNEYDCGCFLLYYIEKFLKIAPLPCKITEETKLFGRRWFRPSQASSLRDRIRDILEQLFEDEPSPQ